MTSKVPVQAFRFDPDDMDGIPAFYTQRVSGERLSDRRLGKGQPVRRSPKQRISWTSCSRIVRTCARDDPERVTHVHPRA